MGWVEDAVESVGDAIGDVWEGVEDVAGDVWDGVSDVAGDIWDGIDDFADDVVDWVDDYWREILMVAGVAAGGWALASGYGGAAAGAAGAAEGAAAAGTAGTLGAEAAAGGILGATEAGVAGLAAEGMAGFGGMTAAEMVAGAAAGTAEAGALGSGMWGIGLGEAAATAGLGEAALGSGMYGLGIGAAEAGAGALGAAELGSGFYGLGEAAAGSGWEAAASGAFEALPAGGMQATGTLGAAPWAEAGLYELGGGFYGTSAADIGALMGTTVDGGFGLGSGMFGVDIADAAAGNFLGDWGLGSAVDGVLGTDWMQTVANTPGWQTNENFGQVTFQEPRNAFLDQLQKQGTKYLKNQAVRALMPQQPMVRQGQGQGWVDPYNGNPPPTDQVADTGASQSSLGGLSQIANIQNQPFNLQNSQVGAPLGGVPDSPVGDIGAGFSSPMDVAYAQQLSDIEKKLQDEQLNSETTPLLSWQDFTTQNNLQNGNQQATLAGYELWRALNSQDSKR